MVALLFPGFCVALEGGLAGQPGCQEQEDPAGRGASTHNWDGSTVPSGPETPQATPNLRRNAEVLHLGCVGDNVTSDEGENPAKWRCIFSTSPLGSKDVKTKPISVLGITWLEAKWIRVSRHHFSRKGPTSWFPSPQRPVVERPAVVTVSRGR